MRQALLQSEAALMYYKEGKVLLQTGATFLYFIAGQVVLQSIEWGNYQRVG